MHRQDRMEHMPMNHPVDNMHRKDNDQSVRPEGENHSGDKGCEPAYEGAFVGYRSGRLYNRQGH